MTTWDDFQKEYLNGRRMSGSLDDFVLHAYLNAKEKVLKINPGIYDHGKLDDANTRKQFYDTIMESLNNACDDEGINTTSLHARTMYIKTRFGVFAPHLQQAIDGYKSAFTTGVYQEFLKEGVTETKNNMGLIAMTKLDRVDIPINLANHVKDGFTDALKAKLGDWSRVTPIAAYSIYDAYQTDRNSLPQTIQNLERKGLLFG